MVSHWFYNLTDVALFEARLFRSGAAGLMAAAIVITLMPRYIRFLKKMDATSDFNGDTPPIFGGLLLVASVVMATLFFAIPNSYVMSILIILIAYTVIGGVDDFVKIRVKRSVKKGNLEKKDYQDKADGISSSLRLILYFIFSLVVALFAYKFIPGLDGHLTVPFIKHETWYPYLPNWLFILLISFVTTSTANGANFTDGFDSLVSIPIVTTCLFIASVAYISGNAIFSEYLLLPYLPGVDELMPICAAMIGATLAYLWYNCPPAEIYMGDGGSIGFGGAIGMMFVLVKAELFLPIVGIVFLGEAVSVVLQIGYFKTTRKLTGTGQRIFRRAPIHDHFKLLWLDRFGLEGARSKVIWRFHLISILGLVIGSLIFFKVR